ncbi:MAG: 50S ribosomal protein L32 [Candidatus Marinimicrobia bacterium]|nr:50S ribosomal protein L32 [Candidatus Neomarinimicrobiota bacterium]|tara:strand:+ start:597 stop:782 length:186 start_codon:yes stop_codon:yes gene_type:complete
MAVPKRKISKTRGRKRRTHWKLNDKKSILSCSKTGSPHLRHRAYYVDGVLYYKGEILQNNK